MSDLKQCAILGVPLQKQIKLLTKRRKHFLVEHQDVTYPSPPEEILRKLNIDQEEKGKFHILEVDLWTRAPIFVDISNFAVPLLMYVLIENHIKGVPRDISDKDSVHRIGYIKKSYYS